MSERISMGEKHIYAAGLVSAGLALLALMIFSFSLEKDFEFFPYDHFFRFRAEHQSDRVPQSAGVLVISIAEDSYEKLGVSPLEMWPRRYHVQLIERLKQLGASVVAFDLLFEGASSDALADAELERALRLMPTVIASDGIQVLRGPGQRPELLKPDERYAQAAGALGHPLVPQVNGLVRKFHVDGLHRLTALPSLAEAALALQSRPFGHPQGRSLINFYGSGGSIPTLPYWRALAEDPALAEIVKGRVVFVGYQTSLGSYASARDLLRTPFPGMTAGVEIHATRAANMLQGNWIRRFDARLENVGIVLGVFAVSYLLFSLSPAGAMLTYFILIVPGWLVASYTAFLGNRFFPGFSALLLLFVAGGLSAVYRYRIESRERRRMTSALQRYLPPKFVKQLVAKQGALGIEARDTEVALLFTDIAGYTSWTRQTSPARRTEVRRRYFDLVDSAIFSQDGTLLIRMGDGVFAIWGAPMAVSRPRERALRCVLEMRKALAEAAGRGEIPAFVTRFGLHYGLVQAGSDGSKHRFEYTANGDAVNLASRLEQLGKTLGTTLLLSGSAIEGIDQEFDFIALGQVQPFGIDAPVPVFTLFEGQPLAMQLRQTWELALRDFADRNWESARSGFLKVAEQEPRLKQVADLYSKYCLSGHAELPVDWSGQLIFDSK